MKRLRQRISFTLVEMLAVVVIIGMLVVAGIPAFMRISTAGSLNSSLRQVSNALALARQYAITQRTTTRVIFPSKYTTDNANGRGWTNMTYVSFAVISSNRAVSGAAAWTYISKWEYLPMGSVFFRHNDSPLQNPKLEYLASDSNVPTNSGGSSGITMNYIEFQPTGAASAVCTYPLIIREGFVTNTVAGGGNPTYGQNGPGVNANTPNNVGTITVDNLIGHISVTRK